jgi:ubiquinone biosynthesis protein UbiJ
MLNDLLSRLSPPAWFKAEVVNRIAILGNHVLQQDSIAQQRLARYSGRRIHLRCLGAAVEVRITPAGLIQAQPLDVATSQESVQSQIADLFIEVKEASWTTLLRTVAQRKKPDIHIAGDVQLAAEVNWLSQNLRWDFEEDLSRILGDALAHQVANVARKILTSLRAFIDQSTAVGPVQPPSQTGEARTQFHEVPKAGVW